MAQITLIEAVTQALAWEMQHDPSVVVLGEDVGVNGGVFRATQGLLDKFGPERVIDTPLDETTIAGITVGLAAQGMKPVAEAQFEGFIYAMLLAAIRDPDPVIFFEPKRIYRQYKEEVPDDGEALPLDVCFVLRDGSDVTLVTWGAQVKETLEAAEALAADGISAEVIDVATLKPLDFDTIHESVRKTGRCVIVHEAPRTAGFGAEISARLAEHAMYDLVAPVERVTGYDTHIPLFRLEMKYLPSVDKIVAAAKRTLAAS